MFRSLALFTHSKNLEELEARSTTLALDIGMISLYSKPESFPRVAFRTNSKLTCCCYDFF